jgi:hypothetical protein
MSDLSEKKRHAHTRGKKKQGTQSRFLETTKKQRKKGRLIVMLSFFLLLFRFVQRSRTLVSRHIQFHLRNALDCPSFVPFSSFCLMWDYLFVAKKCLKKNRNKGEEKKA